jgi:hypothetical protein
MRGRELYSNDRDPVPVADREHLQSCGENTKQRFILLEGSPARFAPLCILAVSGLCGSATAQA